MPVISGLIVSVDAFFIGLSLGLQKQCRFAYLAVINCFLLALCFLGYVIGGYVYELIWFDAGLIVGLSFIALGSWYVLQCFICSNTNVRNGNFKAIIIIGLIMSIEAMLITMGITLIHYPHSTILIPITIAGAHFGYSAFSFYLARTKYIQGFPACAGHIISGLALVIYGMMAVLL